MSFLRLFLLLLGSAALGLAGARAQTGTSVSANAPIINFRLPTFTPEGYRQWLIRGSQVVFVDKNDIDVHELTLTVFSGDARDVIRTLLLSPVAKVAITDQVATGPESIRVIDDSFDAEGLGWRYAHKEKSISLSRRVRVTIHSELKAILK